MALSILKFFIGIFEFIAQGMANLISDVTNYLFLHSELSVNTVVTYYINGLNQYGIWSPIVMLLTILIAGFLIYLELAMGKVAEDLE